MQLIKMQVSELRGLNMPHSDLQWLRPMSSAYEFLVFFRLQVTCIAARIFWNPITFYIFTKVPVELTEHDAFIFLDFVVREKASMNNSKIMLRLLRFSTGEVITVGRMS